MACAEHEGDDTHTPNVTALVVASIQNLRSDVARRAQNVLQRAAFLEGARKAEVRQLQRSLIVLRLYQVVFWLDVSVDDAVVMQVGNTRQHLPHELACSVHRQLRARSSTSSLDGSGIGGSEHLGQRAAFAELHDQMHAFARLKHFIELDYIRMVELSRNLQLIFEMAGVLQLVEGDRLQSAQRSRPPVPDAIDDAIGALAQFLGRLVMVLQKPLRFGNGGQASRGRHGRQH
mmetsp:Transcript_68155/g.160422  ORF Transcript_68155/g.160422 Transcript_68155/m.160422 type:complete len:232 (-) Transcript_68155:374-1069(-)